MTEYTKLLKMVIEEQDTAPPDPECQARAAIYAVADWFYEEATECAVEAYGSELCDFARQAAVQEQELKAALAPPEPDPEEVKKWLVTNCVFSGMPPAPYRAWNEWAEAAVSAKVIQGVHIKAHNPPDKDDAPWLDTTYDGFNGEQAHQHEYLGEDTEDDE